MTLGNPAGVACFAFTVPEARASALHVIVQEDCFNPALKHVGGINEFNSFPDAGTFSWRGVEGIYVKWDNESKGLRALSGAEASYLPEDVRNDAINELVRHRHCLFLEEVGSEVLAEDLAKVCTSAPEDARIFSDRLLKENDEFCSPHGSEGNSRSVTHCFTVSTEKLLDISQRDWLGGLRNALSHEDVRHVTWRIGDNWSMHNVGGGKGPDPAVLKEFKRVKGLCPRSNLLVYTGLKVPVGHPAVKQSEQEVKQMLCPRSTLSSGLQKLAPTGSLGPQTRLVLALLQGQINDAKYWVDGALEANERMETEKEGLLKRAAAVRGFGKRKQTALKAAFPTSRAMLFATKQQLAIRGFISLALAGCIFAALHEEREALIWCGEKRALLWNKETKTKLALAVAPPVDQAEDFLRKHKEFEWYTGQETEAETPLTEPAGISAAAYSTFCNAKAQDLDPNALDASLKSMGLARAVGARNGGNVDLFSALARARSLSGSGQSGLRDWICQSVQEQAGEDAPLYRQLEAAKEVMERDIWVYTSIVSLDGERVLKVKQRGANHESPAPLRLAQHNGAFHALVIAPIAHDSSLVDDMVDDEIDGEIDGKSDCKTDGETDIKELVKQCLQLIKKLTDDVAKESEGLISDDFKKKRAELERAFEFCSGESTVLLGMNGAGKTSLINLLHLLTCIDESDYRAVPADYTPEALQLQFESLALSLQALLSSSGEAVAALEAAGVALDLAPSLADPRGKAADQKATDEAKQLARVIYDHCAGSHTRPEIVLDFGVMPSGKVETTTTLLPTRSSYGRIVHMMLTLCTLGGVQEKAFEFAALVRDKSNEELAQELTSEEKSDLFRIWCFYYALETGKAYEDGEECFLYELPERGTLPKTKDEVRVCDEFERMLRQRFHLTLGRGESLHLDCAYLRSKLSELNDKKNLLRLLVEKVEVFLPAVVFKGGNGFVDLPGLADMDVACEQQTRVGVRKAAAVFVVVPKTLGGDKQSADLLMRTGVVERVLKQSDKLGGRNVAFLINRERGPRFDPAEALGENEQESARKAVAECRANWIKLLGQKNKLLRHEGQSALTDDEVEEIAKETEIRCIYPVLHASYRLNQSHVKQHPEDEKRVLELSNMYWLAGVLAARNLDALVRQMKEFETKALHTLLEDLHAEQRHVVVSQGLRKRVEGLVKKAASGRYESFGMHLDPLLDETTNLLGTLRTKLREEVERFFTEGTEVRVLLDNASEQQPKALDPLLKRLTSKTCGEFTRRRVLDPASKGALPNFHLMPVAFGNDGPLDCEPLVDKLRVLVGETMQRVVQLQKDTGQKMLPVSDGDGDGARDREAVRKFIEDFCPRLVKDNMELGDGFFNSSHEKLCELTEKECAAAIHQCILSKSSGCKSAAHLRQLISSSLALVRREWQTVLAPAALNKFVEKQVDALRDVLTKRGRGRKCLIRKWLTHFFEYVEAHIHVDGQPSSQSSDVFAQLRIEREKLSKLRHALATRSDPKAIGIEAMRSAEHSRAEGQVRDQERQSQGIGPRSRLGHSDVAAPVTRLRAIKGGYERFVALKESGHVLARGRDVSAAAVSALFRKTLKREVSASCPVADVFRAMCIAAWTRPKIQQLSAAADWDKALEAASSQLRACAVQDLACHFKRRDETQKKKDVESLGTDLDSYLQRLRSEEYSGDLLCVWMVSRRWKLNFLVFRPGNGKPVLVTHTNGGIPDLVVETFHLAVVESSRSKKLSWYCSSKLPSEPAHPDETVACELTDADNAASDAEAGRSTRRLSARAEIQSAAADADASTASPKRRGQKRKAPFDRSAS